MLPDKTKEYRRNRALKKLMDKLTKLLAATASDAAECRKDDQNDVEESA